jgi:ABC-type phosphate/phosphonate transport system substrate-binding protein
MYPFATLRPAYDRFWQGVRARVSFAAPELDWDLPAAEACGRRDLLLGQTCGWPLVTSLAGLVRVVGTFDCAVDGAVDGTYRSVLISGGPGSLDDVVRRQGVIVAANSPDSLSGWISLGAVAADAGVSFDHVLWTGAHVASVQAVAERRADLASIDAVTWSHLDEPRVTVVGHGMRVPCLPLVTAASTPPAIIDELRVALAQTVDDPALGDTCAALRIRSFVARDFSDYEPLVVLAQLG